MKNTNESRFDIARAELNEITLKAAIHKSNSKIYKLLWPAVREWEKDFLENSGVGGFYSLHDLEKQYMAVVRPILKKFPDIVIKEMILYGERRLHAKAGGNSSAEARKVKNTDRDEIIIRRYQTLCETGKQRDAAAFIAKSYNLTPTQVRNIIRKHKKNES